jgi:hypothetical protein
MIKITVFCHVCDDDNEAHEMKGSDNMYEGNGGKTQQREFTCPNCDAAVNIMLEQVAKLIPQPTSDDTVRLLSK